MFGEACSCLVLLVKARLTKSGGISVDLKIMIKSAGGQI